MGTAACGPYHFAMTPIREELERLYKKFNRKKYVHPDPLEFLYDYPDVTDREIVGLIASSLAYGKVEQILKSVSRVLAHLGSQPACRIKALSRDELCLLFSGFKHRFTTGDDIAALLLAIKRTIHEYGSVGACYSDLFNSVGGDTVQALTHFVNHMRRSGGIESSFLLPSPEKGSACKRLFLFLRWMVRSDDVDPGGWSDIPASSLLIPLDTHMFAIAQNMGFTRRKQANLRASVEITNNFMLINPEDPVKYDFTLTRFGIREELDKKSLAELLPSEPLL